MSYSGDSAATLDHVDETSDPGLLDQLAKKLNAAPVESEPIDFERMQELETRLADREQLVSILTERLEQAADELDRVKRSGGVHSGTAADSADLSALVDTNREVESKLEQFVAAWEERYEGPALRRMEARLDELREQLENATTRGFMPADSGLGQQFLTGQDSSTPNEGTQFESDAGAVSESDSDFSTTVEQAANSHNDPIRLVLISSDEVPDDLDVPLPQPIDSHGVPEETLYQAVADRDAYIRWLCQSMRRITGQLEDWLSSLRVNSDDMTLNKRVDELEALIRDQARVAEVEVSIERAQLSRERAKLQEEANQLQHDREQLAKSFQAGVDEDDTPLLRRWKKFLKPEDA